MAGLYANKFTIEVNDVARIVFVDERAPAAQGLPMSAVTSAEIVVTYANLKSLCTLMAQIIEKHDKKISGGS